MNHIKNYKHVMVVPYGGGAAIEFDDAMVVIGDNKLAKISVQTSVGWIESFFDLSRVYLECSE